MTHDSCLMNGSDWNVILLHNLLEKLPIILFYKQNFAMQFDVVLLNDSFIINCLVSKCKTVSFLFDKCVIVSELCGNP